MSQIFRVQIHGTRAVHSCMVNCDSMRKQRFQGMNLRLAMGTLTEILTGFLGGKNIGSRIDTDNNVDSNKGKNFEST